MKNTPHDQNETLSNQKRESEENETQNYKKRIQNDNNDTKSYQNRMTKNKLWEDIKLNQNLYEGRGGAFSCLYPGVNFLLIRPCELAHCLLL